MGTPSASYSSSDHPRPRPTESRPSLSTSTAVSERASATGRYHGPTSTLVPRRTRSVQAAANASVARGSSTARCSAGTFPSGVAG